MSSSELRIALLIAGVFVLVAIYVLGKTRHEKWGLRRKLGSFTNRIRNSDVLEKRTISNNQEELLDDVAELQNLSKIIREDDTNANRENAAAPFQPSLLEHTRDKQASQEKLVIIHVHAKRYQKFSGQVILLAIKDLGLEYDEMKIFHHKVDRFDGRVVLFSVANMVRPGTFDLNNMEKFSTPGLSMFMRLPGPEEGLKSFNILLDTATKLAARLNGDLLDDTRSALNPQTISHMREQIQLFSLRHAKRITD